MRDILILIKYRLAGIKNSLMHFSAPGVWTCVFFYFPLLAYIIYTLPKIMIYYVTVLSDDPYLMCGNSLNSFAYRLFFLFIFATYVDNIIMLNTIGHYDEYIHLPFKVPSVKFLLFFEPVFLNILNYFIYIYIVSIAAAFGVVNPFYFLLIALLFFLYKILIFLLIDLIANFSETSLYKYVVTVLTVVLLFYSLQFISVFERPGVRHYVRESVEFSTGNFLPTGWLVATIKAMAGNDITAIALNISFIEAFSFLLYCFTRLRSSDYFYEVLIPRKQNVSVIHPYTAVYRYSEKPVMKSLIMKEIVIYKQFASSLSMLLILAIVLFYNNCEFAFFLLLPMLSLAMFSFETDGPGFSFIKSLPVSVRSYYWIKVAVNAAYNLCVTAIFFLSSFGANCLAGNRLNDRFSEGAMVVLAGFALGSWLNIFILDACITTSDQVTADKKSFRFKASNFLFIAVITSIALAVQFSIVDSGYIDSPALKIVVSIFLWLFVHFFIHNGAIEALES